MGIKPKKPQKQSQDPKPEPARDEKRATKGLVPNHNESRQTNGLVANHNESRQFR